MSLVRFNPFRELANAQTRLNAVLADAYSSGSDGRDWDFGFIPAVDIRNGKDHSLIIETELPGVSKDDVTVRIENRTLTIKGERKRSTDASDGAFHRTERVFGTFVRSFALPETVNADSVNAEYKDGVLTITLPRKEEAKPRAIDVKVA